jgi:hypothetical protein
MIFRAPGKLLAGGALSVAAITTASVPPTATASVPATSAARVMMNTAIITGDGFSAGVKLKATLTCRIISNRFGIYRNGCTEDPPHGCSDSASLLFTPSYISEKYNVTVDIITYPHERAQSTHCPGVPPVEV